MLTRPALVTVGSLVLVAVVALAVYFAREPQIRSIRRDLKAVQAQVTDLENKLAASEAVLKKFNEAWVASGGGTNLKEMPSPSGPSTVPLLEAFGFDTNYIFCRVDTNPQAFSMPTYSMGTVTVDANSFFMLMKSTVISDVKYGTAPDGKRTVTIEGKLDCATEAAVAKVRVGDRNANEPATFKVVAVDGGAGGGEAGDSFAFTVFFDKQAAPLNNAIFGPEFTFTGKMVDGEVTIVKLSSMVR